MEKLLKQFGLSKTEIVIYKTLLKSGGAKISEIAQATKINRTTCQEIVRALEEKGLVVAGERGKILFYQTEDPDKFAQIINERSFVVDRLIPELQIKNKTKKWRTRLITAPVASQIIKRAKRKNIINKLFNYKKTAIHTLGTEHIILSSNYSESPAIEIIAADIFLLHQDLIKKIS